MEEEKCLHKEKVKVQNGNVSFVKENGRKNYAYEIFACIDCGLVFCVSKEKEKK